MGITKSKFNREIAIPCVRFDRGFIPFGGIVSNYGSEMLQIPKVKYVAMVRGLPGPNGKNRVIAQIRFTQGNEYND